HVIPLLWRVSPTLDTHPDTGLYVPSVFQTARSVREALRRRHRLSGSPAGVAGASGRASWFPELRGAAVPEDLFLRCLSPICVFSAIAACAEWGLFRARQIPRLYCDTRRDRRMK